MTKYTSVLWYQQNMRVLTVGNAEWKWWIMLQWFNLAPERRVPPVVNLHGLVLYASIINSATLWCSPNLFPIAGYMVTRSKGTRLYWLDNGMPCRVLLLQPSEQSLNLVTGRYRPNHELIRFLILIVTYRSNFTGIRFVWFCGSADSTARSRRITYFQYISTETISISILVLTRRVTWLSIEFCKSSGPKEARLPIDLKCGNTGNAAQIPGIFS
jgi:hypothetical protein